jgi:hypothetical protein
VNAQAERWLARAPGRDSASGDPDRVDRHRPGWLVAAMMRGGPKDRANINIRSQTYCNFKN